MSVKKVLDAEVFDSLLILAPLGAALGFGSEQHKICWRTLKGCFNQECDVFVILLSILIKSINTSIQYTECNKNRKKCMHFKKKAIYDYNIKSHCKKYTKNSDINNKLSHADCRIGCPVSEKYSKCVLFTHTSFFKSVFIQNYLEIGMNA